jgi:hypothetical protein
MGVISHIRGETAMNQAKWGLAICVVLLGAVGARGEIISGTIEDWDELTMFVTIGDDTNHVTMQWSYNQPNMGFFYGSDPWTFDSDVAAAPGITDVTQIFDASVFDFTSGYVGPLCDGDDGVGDFVIWNNIETGHYGVLRVDDIVDPEPDTWRAQLNGTWWFQTDGTGNFVPEPATLLLLCLGGMAVLRRRHQPALRSG